MVVETLLAIRPGGYYWLVMPPLISRCLSTMDDRIVLDDRAASVGSNRLDGVLEKEEKRKDDLEFELF